MATPVVTVASGGLPVIDVTATFPKLGLPVTEALAGRGIAVTKVLNGGLPVTFSTVADYPAPPFTPTSLVGLTGWWDASATASLTLTGSRIDAVADRSGGVNHVTGHGALTTYPTYDATGFNTRPGIMYAGGSFQAMATNAAFPMGTGNTLTAFLAMNMTAGSSSVARLLSYLALGATHDYDNVGSWLISRTSGASSVQMVRSNVTTNMPITFNTPFDVIYTVNAAGAMIIYLNGVASGTVTQAGNWVTGGTVALGAGVVDAGQHLAGAIGECGIATGYSDAATVAKLHTYLKNKWGLP